LKDKLLQVMMMDPQERARLLNPAKDTENEQKGISALQKLKDLKESKKKLMEQANADLSGVNATVISQQTGAGSEPFSPGSQQRVAEQ
jgi:hypothetical protein